MCTEYCFVPGSMLSTSIQNGVTYPRSFARGEENIKIFISVYFVILLFIFHSCVFANLYNIEYKAICIKYVYSYIYVKSTSMAVCSAIFFNWLDRMMMMMVPVYRKGNWGFKRLKWIIQSVKASKMAELGPKCLFPKSTLSDVIIKGIPGVQRLVLENQAHLCLQKCQPLGWKKRYTLIIFHSELGRKRRRKETEVTKARQTLGSKCKRI